MLPFRAQRFLRAALLATVTSLGACSYQLHVTAVDTRRPHPRFELGTSASPPASGEGHAVAVNELRVVPEVDGQWDWRHPAWCIGLAPGSYIETADVLYGAVPPGFTECASPKPLRFGQRYLVSVSGAGITGSTEFTYGE